MFSMNAGKNRRATSEGSGSKKSPMQGITPERNYAPRPGYGVIYGSTGPARGKAAEVPSVGEARAAESSPDILEAAKVRADREGRSFLEVLREQLSSELSAAEPTELCLTPEETLSFFEERKLPSVRLAHVEECRWCRSMLSEALYAGDGFWEILRRMQAEAKKREEAGAGA